MHSRPLILRLRNWVGDVTLSLPTLERLQDAGYGLRLVGKGWASDLLAGHGWPVDKLGATLGERVRQLRALRDAARAEDPGLGRRINAVSFPYSFSSALELRLAGLRAIGYAGEGRSPLLGRAVPRPAVRHELAVYWQLGTALLGQDAPLPERVQLRLAPRHLEEAAALRQRLGIAPGYLVICPFAGGTFEKLDKHWPGFARYAAQALPPLGRSVLVCPGPGEEEAIAARDYAGCTVARGVGLGAYAALLRDAAAVVANDTGPGHLAAAVGTPLVSVLGPSEPERWGAWGPGVRFVRGTPLWPAAEQVHAALLDALRGR